MNEFDIVVIGAGPAGMTAALYAARGGHSCALIERMGPGGQMGETDHIDNYPGFPEGIDGFELAQHMYAQCMRFGVEGVLAEVSSIASSDDMVEVFTSEGTYTARAVIIASGARSKPLGVEGEDDLRGRGVSYCATCDGGFFRGKDVVVVGGGNTAAADALYLSRLCRTVYVVHRRDALRTMAAGQYDFDAVENVVFVWDSVVEQLLQHDGAFSGVRCRNVKTGETRDIDASAVFVAVGKLPNTEFLGELLQLDEYGYIVADEQGRTSMPGVYAAGDVRVKHLRQVATAVADGANAAEAAAQAIMS